MPFFTPKISWLIWFPVILSAQNFRKDWFFFFLAKILWWDRTQLFFWKNRDSQWAAHPYWTPRKFQEALKDNHNYSDQSFNESIATQSRNKFNKEFHKFWLCFGLSSCKQHWYSPSPGVPKNGLYPCSPCNIQSCSEVPCPEILRHGKLN